MIVITRKPINNTQKKDKVMVRLALSLPLYLSVTAAYTTKARSASARLNVSYKRAQNKLLVSWYSRHILHITYARIPSSKI